MSFINKVKNFFYEDIEEDDEEFEAREAAKREEKFQKKLEKEKKKELIEKLKEEKKEPEIKEPEKDLSERELFKSEKTFNFPIDIGDDIFDITQTMQAPERKEESRNSVREEKNLYARPTTRITPQVSSSVYKEPELPREEGPKRFKPTPVVSPVYGILDKNYTVDDVVEKNLDKTKEFSLEKKIVDFDSVRNKAYKELDEEIEKTLTDSKDIFYNLDEEETKESAPEEISDFVEEAYDKDENNDDSVNIDDVIITYEGEVSDEPAKEVEVEETKEEVTPEEDDEEDFSTPDIEIPKVVKRGRKKVVKEVPAEDKKEEVEEKSEKEDLFNLIDNMYNDEEDEEEDD